MPQPVNILLIFNDQHQQRMMGAYGDDVVWTPRLDELAERSVLFRNAIVAQPVCTPARASLLTGTYGHTHGSVKNNRVLTEDIPTAAEILGGHGYRCGYIGKWHIGNEVVPQRGFEEFYRATEDTYTSNKARVEQGQFSAYDRFLRAKGLSPECTEPWGHFTRGEACRLPEDVGKPAFTAMQADEFFRTEDDRPFFLTVNLLEPHPPYFSPFDDMYAGEDIALPPNYHVDEEEIAGWSRRTRAFRDFYFHEGHNVKTSDVDDVLANLVRYYGLITLMDKYVGRILDSLEAAGLAENTIVVFTSDHGDMMGSHQIVDKGMMFEESIKVPLTVRDPREDFARRECEAVVNNVDVLPTLLEMAGLPVPDHIEGRSFLRLLRGEDDSFPDFGVVEWNGELQNMHSRSPIFADVLDAHVRCVVTPRWKLVLTPGDRSELYDLENDPLERRNVFDDPENRPVVADLYQRLLGWQRDTNDRLEVPNPLDAPAP